MTIIPAAGDGKRTFTASTNTTMTTVNRMISMLKRRMPMAKSVGRRLLRKARRKSAERRPAAGAADQDGGGAADHGCAGEDGVRCRRPGSPRRGALSLACFFRRVGFAGQQRLVDVKVAALQQARESAGTRSPATGSTMSPGTNRSDRARKSRSRRVGRSPSPRPRRARASTAFLRAYILHEVEHDADQDDADDHNEARRPAGQRGDTAGDQQDHDQRVLETHRGTGATAPCAFVSAASFGP